MEFPENYSEIIKQRSEEMVEDLYTQSRSPNRYNGNANVKMGLMPVPASFYRNGVKTLENLSVDSDFNLDESLFLGVQPDEQEVFGKVKVDWTAEYQMAAQNVRLEGSEIHRYTVEEEPEMFEADIVVNSMSGYFF